MPTYLTPGVYVEEVPSASKPIEGVSTSIAAFVGLAPGGPVNTPMRISNWTQFSKIFGDPNEPDNGPFMEGAYLAHSVYGFFQNGGNLCWVVRVGDDGGNTAAAARRAAGGGRRDRRDVPRRGARVRQRRRQGRADRGALRGREGRRQDLQARRLLRLREGGARGPDAQEGPHQHRDEGQRGLQAGQDRGDRRFAAGGPAGPGDRQLHAVQAVDPARQGQADPLRGRRGPAPGHGRPRGRGRDHDGRDAGHHDASATTSRSATSRAR